MLGAQKAILFLSDHGPGSTVQTPGHTAALALMLYGTLRGLAQPSTQQLQSIDLRGR